MPENQVLTEKELNKIFSWLPYRQDWPVDRNERDDNINEYYGTLIRGLTTNSLFDTYHSQDGGMTNYLEFLCYPAGYEEYNGAAIIVCISLCAPIAAFAETTFRKTSTSWAHNFISPDMVGIVLDNQLKDIEKEILRILKEKDLIIIDKDYAALPLTKEVADNLMYQNLNNGSQYLHGLFQFAD